MHARVLFTMSIPASIVAVLAGAHPTSAGAQTDVTLEFGAAQVGAPLGLDSESTRFFIGGVRGSHYSFEGSGVFGSLLAGRTFGDADAADFFTVTAGGTLVERWTESWEGSLDVRVLGFGVEAPYPYRAFAVESGISVRYHTGPLSLEVAGITGSGSSHITLWRFAGGPTRTFGESLRRVGGTAELMLGGGSLRVGAVGGVHGTSGGTFSSGGGRAVLGGAWGALELRADVWRTPLGTETTGGLSMVLPLSGWSLRGFFGRTEPDPLTLSEPSGTGGSLLVGRTLYTRDSGPAARGPLMYEVMSRDSVGARVRLSVEAPAGARSVALLADFTLWDPVAMESRGDRWEVELEVPAGTHHYGYLVDDEWYVPEGTRDVVPDEWGRTSAILVIEGAN